MNLNFGVNSLANYEKKEIIGKGAYGEVYRAIDKRSKQTVALKKVLIEMDSEGFPSNSIRQISILREIHHQNIISLFDVIIDQKRLYLVFEYGDQDLKTYLEALGQGSFMDPQSVKKFLFELLSGIADCHVKRIIHRDLKPANLLIDKNGRLKIADFGLARTYSVPVRPYSHEVVTLWYRAPQILLGCAEYSTPIDIWAIGCIFAEMITKRPLFEGDSEIDQLFRIFRTFGTPNEIVWPGVTEFKDYKRTFPNWAPSPLQETQNLNLDDKGLDLLKQMLRYDPNMRITAKRALKHQYFQDMQTE